MHLRIVATFIAILFIPIVAANSAKAGDEEMLMIHVIFNEERCPIAVDPEDPEITTGDAIGFQSVDENGYYISEPFVIVNLPTTDGTMHSDRFGTIHPKPIDNDLVSDVEFDYNISIYGSAACERQIVNLSERVVGKPVIEEDPEAETSHSRRHLHHSRSCKWICKRFAR